MEAASKSVHELLREALCARHAAHDLLLRAVELGREEGWSFARLSAGMGHEISPEALDRPLREARVESGHEDFA